MNKFLKDKKLNDNGFINISMDTVFMTLLVLISVSLFITWVFTMVEHNKYIDSRIELISISEKVMDDVVKSDKSDDSIESIKVKWNDEVSEDLTVDAYRVDECFYVKVVNETNKVEFVDNYGKCIVDVK